MAERNPFTSSARGTSMTDTNLTKTEAIRALNDAFRRSFIGGAVMITAGVEGMPPEQRRSLLDV
jgi:hypothetical protein